MKFFACCKSKTNTDAKTEVMVAVPTQDYHQLLHKLKESGGKFNDVQFPPNESSLCQKKDVYKQ